ncbi:MAG: glutamate racemase [Chloroflexi bacterium]|nr:glutamate racemase [Chloroflexota bacterium]
MESSHRPIVPSSGGPIGLFDSGVGGLSVWRALVERLPAESTVYLADQAHAPYGPRSLSEVRELARAAAGWLIEQGAKLVVAACNTASAAALDDLRREWPRIPFVGMEPAIKPASERTKTGRVGVMATPGTLTAPRFHHLVERFASGVEVHTQVCPGLVEWVEAGRLNGPEVMADLRRLLRPLTAAGVDHLVLGCTHYPFLAPAIQQVMGDKVTLVDPAPAVARQVERVLAERGLLAPASSTPQHRLATTGDPTRFRETLAALERAGEIELNAAVIARKENARL